MTSNFIFIRNLFFFFQLQLTNFNGRKKKVKFNKKPCIYFICLMFRIMLNIFLIYKFINVEIA